jgi:hypothetical protein
MKKYKSSELEFVSRINRDGKGVERLKQQPYEDVFKLSSLSIAAKTFIATCGMNHFIVKIKEAAEPEDLGKFIERKGDYLGNIYMVNIIDNTLKEICEEYYELKIKHEKYERR